MMKLKKILSGLMTLILTCAAYGEVELVKDGKAVSDIVVDKDALSSVKFAADDLQKHMELISGAKVEIVNTPSEKVKNHIYVGPSDYTKKLGVTVDDLKVEGFKIIAKENYLVLIGRDEQREAFPYSSVTPGDLEKWQKFAGEKYALPQFTQSSKNNILGFKPLDATATLYAVSEFLEQQGVRWYNPYENGTVIPEKKTITAAAQNIKKEPKFPYREFNYAIGTDPEGLTWFKRLKYGSSYLYFCNHTINSIICVPGMKEQHPEYYAVSKGKPITKNGGAPRLCDPGFRTSSVNFLNKVFEACPPLRDYSLGMPDGFTEIDERDAAIWERPDSKGKYSDYVWDYWLYAAKELEKSHPDKNLSCMAYTTYLQPPSNIDKLPDNVTLTMCYWTTWMIIPESEERRPGGNELRKLRADWLSKLTSKKLYIWDYYLFYRENSPKTPAVFTKLLQKEMQDLNGVCEGKFIEIESTKGNPPWKLSCPGLSHLLHYWQGKLYWDPDMDREKMLNEYYELYFGPARAEMKEFHEFAEEVWMRPESRSITLTSGFLKEKDVDRYFEILKRARDKAGKDTVYDKRIAQIETEMESLKKLFPNLKQRGNGPQFRVFARVNPFNLDGDLEKPFWTEMKNWYNFTDMTAGKDVPTRSLKSTQVAFRMTKDRSVLLVGLKCAEPEMDKIVAKTKDNDDRGIYKDDYVELVIETPGHSYFRIAVNPNGAILDESQDPTIIERDTLPLLWNPGIKTVVKKEKDRWTAEIMIPVKDFGKIGPTEAYPWGINVCRNRMVGGKSEKFALVPSEKAEFPDMSKLGILVMR
ncbi:MAG: DUF4838 domain-containing protein [Lentisphaerota bacterium]